MDAKLDHIVLNVVDVERALAFYTRVIGLAPERVEEYRAGQAPFPSVRLNAETVIDVFPPQFWGGDQAAPAVGKTNVDHVCIAVDASEWPALQRRLAEAGVEHEMGPSRLWGARGEATAVYIRDPEGNRLELRHYG